MSKEQRQASGHRRSGNLMRILNKHARARRNLIIMASRWRLGRDVRAVKGADSLSVLAGWLADCKADWTGQECKVKQPKRVEQGRRGRVGQSRMGAASNRLAIGLGGMSNLGVTCDFGASFVSVMSNGLPREWGPVLQSCHVRL